MRVALVSLLFLARLLGAQEARPDLSGVWDFRTLTPLERPSDLGDKATLTAEEAAEMERKAVERAAAADAPSDVERSAPEAGQSVGGYNNFWFDRGAKVSDDLRTSLIVDPPNGRLPQPRDGIELQVIGDTPTAEPVRLRVGGIGVDDPENRGLAERCLLGFNAGPPITPGGYNQNIKLVLTDDHLMLMNEMNHDVRAIRIDSEHESSDMTRWMGDSVATWDGDTLVVSTRNFNDKRASFSNSPFNALGSGTTLELTEKFSLIDADTLRYEFTVSDDVTFPAPITAVLLMKRSEQKIFEYACHEGNYAMGNMLRGARLEERESGAD